MANRSAGSSMGGKAGASLGEGEVTDFILPDLGEGVHEAEIISWKVKVGDVVEEMQTLAEMETDKALVEVPSPYAGTIVALHGKVGEIAHVGKPIVTFRNASRGGTKVGGGGGSAATSTTPSAGATSIHRGAGSGRTAAAKLSAGSVSDYRVEEEEGEREDAGTVVGSMENAPALGREGGEGKAMATPAVRRLAKEMGVDIDRVPGTGRGGRVTASDVERAAGGKDGDGGGEEGGQIPLSPAPDRHGDSAIRGEREKSGVGPLTGPSAAASVMEAATAGRIAHETSGSSADGVGAARPVVDAAGVSERVPFKGVRRKIAEALDRSVRTAVHFTVMDTADVTALDRLRRQQEAASGEAVSFLPFVIQAVCRAIKKFPRMNANVDDAAQEILVKGVINVGVAVDTEHGLMVPVVPNADRMGVLQMGRAIGELAAKCRARTIGVESLRGGTFTVSNVGSYGGAFATPIINYPEVGILGVGRARETVMAKGGGIYVGMQMPLSMSCDHRVVDGAYSAKMLNQVIGYLEKPEILLEPAGR